MSFWSKIERRRDSDVEYAQDIYMSPKAERQQVERSQINVSASLSPADIELLEEERVPWLRKRRRR